MKKWFRRTLRRLGLEVPFTQLICTDRVRTIAVDADWRATVTVQSTLVFLEAPEEGDLRDPFPVDPETDRECVIHTSPDARELGRRKNGTGTFVYWKPREPVNLYSPYIHKYSWSSEGWEGKGSLYTELRCDIRTGVQTLEMIAPLKFETAVVFKRPRWRRWSSERRFVKYALHQLESGTEARPLINNNGQRVEWRVIGPKVGDRHICIAFTADGLAQWRRQLKETSITGRVKGLFRSVVPT